MAEIASAFVSLVPSARGFGRGIENQVGGDMRRSGSRMGGLLGKGMKVGLLAGGAVAAGVGAAFISGLKGAAEYEKITARTANVIKTTGGAAGVSAKQIAKLGSEVEGYSSLTNEAVESGANLLLTFTNIKNKGGKGNDVFSQTTKAAADMSVAMGTDVPSAAMQLGKALNDPSKGMSKLMRSGVSFTAAQVDQVKKLQSTGHTLEAQKIILGEVQKEFGGAAKAAGGTFAGSLARLKNQFGDLLRDAVMPLLPGLTKFVGLLADKMPGVIGGAIATVKRLVTTLAPVGKAIGSVFAGLNQGGETSSLLASFKTLAATVSTNVLPVVKTLAGLFATNVLPVLVQVGRSVLANLVPTLKVAANTFKTVVLPAVLALAGYLGRNLFPIFKAVAGIIATQVVPIVFSLARILYGTVYPAVVKIAMAIGANLKPVFDQLFKTIRTQVLPAVRVLLAKLMEWMPTIRKVVAVVLKVVGVILIFAAAILGKVLPVVLRLAGFLIKVLVVALIHVIENGARVIGFIIRFGKVLVGAIVFAAKFQIGILRTIGKVLVFFNNLPTRISNALGHLGGLLVGKGKDLVRGLWEGIRGMGAWLMRKVKGFVLDHVPGPVAKALGIASPSKVMAKQAQWIPRGMAKGIDANAHHVDRAVTRLAGRVQVSGSGLDASNVMTSGGAAGAGGQQIRGTLGIDRDGVAYIHGVSRGEVHQHAAAQQASDRAAAMSL